MQLTERLQELVDQIDYDYGRNALAGMTATVHQRGEEFVVVHRYADGRQYMVDELGSYIDGWHHLSDQLEAPEGYQVGDLDSTDASDPVCPSLNAALEEALNRSGIEEDPNPIGIWSHDDDAELLYVAVGGILFSKW